MHHQLFSINFNFECIINYSQSILILNVSFYHFKSPQNPICLFSLFPIYPQPFYCPHPTLLSSPYLTVITLPYCPHPTLLSSLYLTVITLPYCHHPTLLSSLYLTVITLPYCHHSISN